MLLHTWLAPISGAAAPSADPPDASSRFWKHDSHYLCAPKVADARDEVALLQTSCRQALARAESTEAGVVAALRSKEELRAGQDAERGRMAEQLVRACVCVCVLLRVLLRM